MALFGRDDDGKLRIAGVPVAAVWSADAVLDSFEPENPRLLVPRRLGLGWDLNLGAVAVRAGWIRPDDSLPDLARYVPGWFGGVLRVAPWVGAAAVGAGAVAVARRRSAATKWSLAGKPTRFNSGVAAALAPALLPAVVAWAPKLVAEGENRNAAAVSVAQRAHLLGAEAASAALLHAAYRSADNPRGRQLSAVASPLLWLAVTGGVQVAAVKLALNSVATRLRG